MNETKRLPPVALTIFGVSGDLTWRMLGPALFDLYRNGELPERFAILGVSRSLGSNPALRSKLKTGVARFSRGGKPDEKNWRAFAEQIQNVQGDIKDPKTYQALDKKIAALEKQWNAPAQRVFYLATPPSMFQEIPRQLGRAGMSRDRERVRLVIEKPFGADLDSACKLNRALGRDFEESQIYRIDHFLGKETVQNLLVLRFANPMFEPVWNRQYVDHVTITVAEDIGIGHRAGFFERTGTLRDMVQNHLMQLFCLVAMEPMQSFNANDVRNKKLDVLRAVRPIPHEAVHDYAARGQYDRGWVEGKKVPGYREEQGVAPDSQTETFAALKLFVDNWRWAGVPFYLRTGKRMARASSEIAIHFREMPHQVFPREAMLEWDPGQLTILMTPDEGIVMRFQAKQPGPGVHLRSVNMQFSYARTFGGSTPDAYETLLLDVMQGDPTLFMRFDQVEAAWQIIQPVLDVWLSTAPVDFPNYAAGTWGPASSAALLAKERNNWPQPAGLRRASKTR